MKQRIIDSTIAGLMTLVLTSIIMGVQVSREAGKIVIDTQFAPVLIATALVVIGRFAVDDLVFKLLGAMGDKLQQTRAYVAGASTQSMSAKKKWILYSAVFVAAAIWPFFAGGDLIYIASLALIYVLLGLGLNIVVGYAGLLDLGFVAFYAVGAYSYALLAHYLGWSFWVCLPIGALLAALFGAILGFPVLRLRGDYLAIVTLGFGEIIRLVLNNWDSLTGGPDGIGRIPFPTFFGLQFTRRARDGGTTFHEYFGLPYSSHYKEIFFYLICLLLVVFTLFVINRLIRMPVGRAWEALREDEIACRSLGLGRTPIKLSAFTLGAFFGGLAGVLFAAKLKHINPESFTFIESAIVLAIVVLGGMGSQIGVILAAIAMTVLPEVARGFEEYRMLIFGLVMVLMMIWRPQGLLPAKRPAVSLS